MNQEDEMGKHEHQQQNPRILSATQAVRLIEKLSGVRISKSTLWRWHLVGRLTGTRIGKRFFTTQESVESMLRNDALPVQHGPWTKGAQSAERIENSFHRARIDA